MGDSQPPSADVDLVGSYARRRGADVEIVLAAPRGDVASATALVLRRGKVAVTAPAAPADVPTGPALVARLPRADLANGRWTITLGGSTRRLAARLLVQGDRPLVLLWGASNPASVEPPPRRKSPMARRAASAGRALDRALERLPDERAERVRTSARRVARRVLG